MDYPIRGAEHVNHLVIYDKIQELLHEQEKATRALSEVLKVLKAVRKHQVKDE